MRGFQNGPFGDLEGGEAASRRLTPSIGLEPESAPANEAANEAANEDFLFHLYRGSELLQDNRAHEAKEELERALQLQPNDAKGRDLLAVVYFRLGLYPRAIAIYEQLRRSSPRDPALLLNLALCYLKTGQAALARRDLELLLTVNPSHARAWGYLGLACERLGALPDAQRAFKQGGHAQMAKRMRDRASQAPAAAQDDPSPSRGPREDSEEREARDVVAAAFQELDAGELSFELAKPASERDGARESWRPIELGQLTPSVARTDDGMHAPRGEDAGYSGALSDTHDGAPPSPNAQRRPTLTVGVAPPPSNRDIEALSRVLSPRPPPFALDEHGRASPRHQVVVMPPVRAVGAFPPTDLGSFDGGLPTSGRTVAPGPLSEAPMPEIPRAASVPPPPIADLTRDSIVTFPESGSVVIHKAGVALVKTKAGGQGFAARLEAVRASSNALTMALLERHMKGKPTGESFGGVGSPLVQATGEGQLMLAPRAGRTLTSFTLQDELCFMREEVLLGFQSALTFENGKLATGEGESFAVVQLKGTGAVLLEGIGEILTLEVHEGHGLSVRREVILGWFGRLVPRALAPSEAPCGQRGLVSFAGQGRVLVASA